jgi:hypothetical protein
MKLLAINRHALLAFCVFSVAMASMLIGTQFVQAQGNDILKSIDQRFVMGSVEESPDFQRHVVPLFGRLGCNARACHGSFQGQGGFQLSLFGYDFKADHAALLDQEHPRVNLNKAHLSLIIEKPTDADNHEGGLRYEKDSWQYHVIQRWIESGAKYERLQKLVGLEITPNEIIFAQPGEQIQLQAVAVWEDGTHEDVTPLCRFETNDDLICTISQDGLIVGKEAGDTHVVISYDKAVVPIPVMRAVTDLAGQNYPAVNTTTDVDRLIVNKLRKLGIVPSELCSDTEFLRRVRFDLTGTLPTADEVKAFVADSSADKRTRKIDALLESPAYAAWWTTKLCDFTGNNDQQLQNALPSMKDKRNVASQAWYDWIYRRVEQNVPYDQLVEGIVTATSVPEGSSYLEYCEEMCDIYRGTDGKSFADMPSMPLYWARQDFRQVEPRTINFAYAFMGIRIQCAQCHKHPFDQWSKEDFAQFTGFFKSTQASNNQPPNQFKNEYQQLVNKLGLSKELRGNMLRQEIDKKLQQGETIPFNVVYVNRVPERKPDNNKSKNKKPNAKDNQPDQTARLLGGDRIKLSDYADSREPLMAWLRAEDNPYFAKAFVNRVWAAYFHRGIVHPADDLSLANPPANAELLDYLAQGFYDSQFDMKWVHRTILNSDTYQRSWKPNDSNASDEKNFSHAIPRRLPAEVAYDAIVSATASDQVAAKLQTEIDDRAIAVPGSNGRNPNYAGNKSFALQVFGRSTRESSCECDRADDASLLQTVFLQNDPQVSSMLTDKQSWIQQLSNAYGKSNSTDRDRAIPKNYDQVVAGLKKEIERLEKRDNKSKVEAAQRRLADYERSFKEKIAAAKAESKSTNDAFNAEEIITQAYLRTLSRWPDEDELKRCQQYISAAKDPISGTRDVLWALINTKEFIVNH